MEKKDLIQLIDNAFKKDGYIRKGNNWTFENDVLLKHINLQKSNFGNYYYLNYGYSIKELGLEDEVMHIYNRLTSKDIIERNEIEKLFDFDSKIEEHYRLVNIERYLNLVKKELNRINDTSDLSIYLKNREHLNDVSLKVKKYLGFNPN
jgi:hypothetical protein